MIASLAKRLPFFYGWVVVGVAFVTMALGVNARTAFSLVFAPVIDEFGWERGLTAGAFSFGFLVSAFLSPVVSSVMDRRGPRLVIEAGVLCLGLGLMLSTFIRTPLHLYLTFGLLVGFGSICTGYSAQSLFLRTGSCASAGSRSVSPSPVSASGRSFSCRGCRRSSTARDGGRLAGRWASRFLSFSRP